MSKITKNSGNEKPKTVGVEKFKSMVSKIFHNRMSIAYRWKNQKNDLKPQLQMV